MNKVLDLNNLIKPLKIGEIVNGRIIGIGHSSAYVDLGFLGTGIIYGKEFYKAKDIIKNVKRGDKIFVKIIDLENEDGYIELSISEANQEIGWAKLEKLKEESKTITIKVLGANKGGLLTQVFGIPAFLPVSQLSSEHYPRVKGAESAKILEGLQKLIGKELEVKIFDINQNENKLILSERAKETQKIEEILKNYKVGDVVEGEITGIVDFGAFIKFPLSEEHKGNSAIPKEGRAGEKENTFLEGLIHISELDWRLIENPSKIVKIGQKVKAKIIDISNGRVSLSLKALKKDPWEDIEKKYKKGEIVEGIVTKINPFGAFVKISPKIQGLVHISGFDSKSKMEEKLKQDKKYNFQILSVDAKDHKMSLKLKE